MPLTIATLWRFAPYIGGVVLAIGAYAWAYDNGRDTEREKWQRQAAIEAQKVREQENALQAQVDAAGAALSAMTEQLAAMRQSDSNKRNVFYVQNPTAAAAVCLPDSRFLHHQERDREAAAALAAGQRP